MVGDVNLSATKPNKSQFQIFTLGRFEVYCGNDKLFDETGRYQKLVDLFMFFISHRGKLFYPETILETLWPGKEYKDPRNVMKNMVYRLKQELIFAGLPEAKTYINFMQGGYTWKSDASCWIDADAFKTLCESAGQLVEAEPLGAIETYRKALQLYKGHYLPGVCDDLWVLPIRQSYRQLFLRSISKLMNLQKEYHLFSQMALDCEAFLEIESFDEELHLFYLEALLEEGKTTQALSHYEYITSLKYNEMGAKPSQAMQRIYQAINLRKSKTKPAQNELQKLLIEQDVSQGAQLCDPDTFHLFFRLEKCRAEREGTPIHMGIISLSGNDACLPGSRQYAEMLEHLQQLLHSNLRKTDMFSNWNENHFTLLLQGASIEQAEAILTRIKETFRKDFPDDKLVLSSSVHRIMPLK